MIEYAITYEIIDEKSAEHGDVADSGWISEKEHDDFRSMIDILEGTEPSCSDVDLATWFTHYGEMDYKTGEYENRSYHPANDRDLRYMIKAWKAAN